MQSFSTKKTPWVAFSTSSDTVALIHPKADGSRPRPGEPTGTNRLLPGEYVFLLPYWYRIEEETEALVYLGKTSQLRYDEEAIHLELATLTDGEIDSQMVMGDLVVPIIHVIDQQTANRSTLWQPGRDRLKGDYYQVDDNLYQVGNGGYLKLIGKNIFETSYEDFAQGFTRLTGLPVIDGNSRKSGYNLTRVKSKADLDRLLAGMSLRERQQFIQEYSRQFGALPR